MSDRKLTQFDYRVLVDFALTGDDAMSSTVYDDLSDYLAHRAYESVDKLRWMDFIEYLGTSDYQYKITMKGTQALAKYIDKQLAPLRKSE